jgi:hypothetical protein
MWRHLRTGIKNKKCNYRSSLLPASKEGPCSVAIGGGTPSCFQSRKVWPYLAALSYTPLALYMQPAECGWHESYVQGLWMVLWNVALRDLN